MTGWAQVQGLHGDTSIPDRARFDNQYIEYWSPWWDAVIVARTVGIVIRAFVLTGVRQRRRHRVGSRRRSPVHANGQPEIPRQEGV
jgi:hypothetical protein